MSAPRASVLLVFWRHVKKYPRALAALLSLIVLGESLGVVTPWLYKRLIDQMAAAGDLRQPGILSALLLALGLALLSRVVCWGLWRTSGFVASFIQPRVVIDLEQRAFAYLLDNSYQFFSNSFAGSLVRSVNRLGQGFVDVAESVLWRLLPLLVSSVEIVIVLLFRRPSLGMVVLVGCSLYIGFNIFYVRWKQPTDIARAAKDSEVTGVLADALTNHANIQLFTGRERERRYLAKVMNELLRLVTRSWRLGEYSNIIQNVLSLVVEALAMYVVISSWYRGQLTIGDVVLVQTYLGSLYGKLFDIGRVIRRFYEAVADAQEMVDTLHTPHDIQDAKNAKPLHVARGGLAFQDISFRYHHDRPILQGFDLAVAPGERVALVGPSGAGKSTIVKLLFHFYDLQRGRILIDGQSIAKVTQDSLRAHISLVPQDPILFHRSLLENIRYGRPEASDEEVVVAAKQAHCHEFIDQLPKKYDTLVGERGIKLSGGERQRVAIARAILKNAPILVLDEATSSLDSESEIFIQAALRQLMERKTVIVIAHRLSTIMQMDRIIVMEDGRVTDQGTHQQLLNKPSKYKTLWEIQAGGFLG